MLLSFYCDQLRFVLLYDGSLAIDLLAAPSCVVLVAVEYVLLRAGAHRLSCAEQCLCRL